MLYYEQVLPHAGVFVLVLARMSGLFILAPILSTSSMPARAKAALVLGLAAVVYPTIDHDYFAPGVVDVQSVIWLCAMELLVGLSIGALLSIPVMAVQLAGTIMGQQMGLALAEQFNPAMDVSGMALGQFLFITTVASFILIGGLEFAIGALVHTFTILPAGGFQAGLAPAEFAAALLSSGFSLALRIAFPVLAIIAMETIAVGFIMKTVPALNVMNFGFPIRILLGIFGYLASLAAMKQAINMELFDVMSQIENWVRDLGMAAESVRAAGAATGMGG